MKRITDILFAAVLLVAFFPLFLLIGLGILVSSGTPVLFVQVRPGLNELPFRMLKFRTMSADLGASKPSQVQEGDRVTRLGRFLRATSLDELPQLINVLKGEMSFIGPRPLLLGYLPYFTERERLRFRLRPGITGWAQINGRNFVPWDDRLRLDVWYVENWSLRLDLLIFLRTLRDVATARGFSADPMAGMLSLDREREHRRDSAI